MSVSRGRELREEGAFKDGWMDIHLFLVKKECRTQFHKSVDFHVKTYKTIGFFLSYIVMLKNITYL